MFGVPVRRISILCDLVFRVVGFGPSEEIGVASSSVEEQSGEGELVGVVGTCIPFLHGWNGFLVKRARCRLCIVVERKGVAEERPSIRAISDDGLIEYRSGSKSSGSASCNICSRLACVNEE